MSDRRRQAAAQLRVTVDPDAVEVGPGTTGAVDLLVSSTAVAPIDVVIDPLGPYAAWCEVTPPRLRISSEGDAQASVTVRVPERLPSPPAAPIVIGLRAAASDAGVLPHVGELRVDVPVTVALRLDIVPPVQRVSGRARFAAIVSNDGAAPLRVRLAPGDTAPEVLMRVRPREVQVRARGRARAKVVVWAAAPWTGEEPDHAFTVRAEAGGEQIDALGSFVQRTRAGTAMLALAAGLIVVALALLALLVGRI